MFDIKPDELDFDVYKPFQRGWYQAEKIIFGLLGVFVIAALFGFLGDDQRGTESVLSPDHTIQLTFSRFGRFSALSKLGVEEIAHVPSGEIYVLLNKKFLAGVDVEKIQPQPVSQTVNAEGVLYKFDSLQNLYGHIEFYLRNQKVGVNSGVVYVQAVPYPIHRIILP